MSASTTRTAATLAGLALAAGAVTMALPAAQADAATGRTFYVSPQGSDANTGTDASHPFQSLGKVSNGFLQPGDTLLLQGGATFSSKLAVWSSGTSAQPITVSDYGTGTPTLTGGCLDVGGSYITVQHLLVTGCSDDSGIWVYGSNDVISDNQATHNIQAVVVDTHAQGAKIIGNDLSDNDRMAPNTPGTTDDYGAIGIVVDGDNTEVGFNRISDNVAQSADFGEDGSAVEIYGGQGTNVHDNLAVDNSTFTELGNARTANTTFTGNRVFSDLDSSQFLVTRGAQDYFGPVAGTTAVDNTVTLTGAQSTGYICYAGCTPTLFTMTGNVLNVAGRIGYLEGTLGGGDNTYWAGTMSGLPMLPGDQIAKPATDAGSTDASRPGKGHAHHGHRHGKPAHTTKGGRNS